MANTTETHTDSGAEIAQADVVETSENKLIIKVTEIPEVDVVNTNETHIAGIPGANLIADVIETSENKLIVKVTEIPEANVMKIPENSEVNLIVKVSDNVLTDFDPNTLVKENGQKAETVPDIISALFNNSRFMSQVQDQINKKQNKTESNE